MENYDENGNWIETFRSIPYETKEEASKKINSVVNFYINESGWELNGKPYVETVENRYIAVIPLKKPAQMKTR